MFIIEIIKDIGIMFYLMSPYLILGLFFVALLNLFINKDMIKLHIGDNNFLSILKAALFGVPLPLCSCGVVPTTVYFAKNGASKPALISFLISTPQTGIDSIIASYGMLGWVFAIYRPIVALIMGITGGFFIKYIDKDSNEKQQLSSCDFNTLQTSNNKQTFLQRTILSLKYAFIDFLDDIAIHLLVGIIISGIIAYLIPDGFFNNIGLSNTLIAMIAMVVIGIPMYVCSTASIPIAITLMIKGFSPGVAFVFLVAGPATNAASIAVLYKVLGKKLTTYYLIIIFILAILFGIILDMFFVYLNISPISLVAVCNHHSIDINYFYLFLTILFFGLILMSLYRRLNNKIKRRKEMGSLIKQHKLIIEGMSCNHCVNNVKNAVTAINGVSSIEIILSENTAYIQGDCDINEVKKVINSIGYKVI